VRPQNCEDNDPQMSRGEDLLRIYGLLNEHFGNLRWWPADGPFEVMVGAILTQNTAWTNVEKAIVALKEKGLLSPKALSVIDEDALSEIIRSSGYHRVKAKRLKALVRFLLEEYSGRIAAMSREELPVLRDKLLAIRGVGPETADSILLYACGKPVFISDTYTHRILARHHLIAEDADGQEIRALFMTHLPHDVPLFNQFHALLVCAGKDFCRTIPKCKSCPLRVLLSEPVPS
jgi:endonuclease III related protein